VHVVDTPPGDALEVLGEVGGGHGPQLGGGELEGLLHVAPDVQAVLGLAAMGQVAHHRVDAEAPDGEERRQAGAVACGDRRQAALEEVLGLGAPQDPGPTQPEHAQEHATADGRACTIHYVKATAPGS